MDALDSLERALLAFVWQGAAVALVTAGVMALMSRRSAHGRYVVACLGLLTMAVLPLVTFLGAVMEGLGPVAATSGLTPEPLLPVTRASTTLLVDTAAREAVVASPSWLELPRHWLLPAWCCGVLLLSARTLVSWYAAQRMSRLHTQEPAAAWAQAFEQALSRMKLTRPVRLLASARVDVPQVIGLWRPLILVPAGAIVGLTPAQLEAVLSHELAHIQRHDYLVNLLQALVETFLFYHPAVWWLSHRIREEREHCADDLAVRSCGDAVLYARALAHIEQVRASPSPVLALGANGGSLLSRIRRLLGVPESHAPRRPWRLVSGLGGAALAVALGSSQVPLPAMAVAPVTPPILSLPTSPAAQPPRTFAMNEPADPRPLVAPLPKVFPASVNGPGKAPLRLTAKPSPRKPRVPPPATLLIPDTEGIARTELPRTPYSLDAEPALAVAAEEPKATPPAEAAPAPAPAVEPVVAMPQAPSPIPSEDGIFTLGPGITPPRFVSGQRLNFADLTQNIRSRVSAVPKGVVVTRCTITTDGSVTDCKSLQGLSGLEDGIIRTLTTWRYAPATLDGKPVPVHYDFDVWFTNEPGGGVEEQRRFARADVPGTRADGSSQNGCVLCASVSASSLVTPPIGF
ncbi:energy transducer TonB [Myxococcus landrumensis]|uniref:Energy transducer TonB n=2 Tax=Myxococcus landrumensis TaxID=2813577 RepID=A0ABX7NES4_9BACT|nr:energy transducer TonB [Myxococcus landrumus]